MNNSFGGTRNIGHRMDDMGYAMAVGSTQQEIEVVANRVVFLTNKIAEHNANIKNMWVAWENCRNTDCKGHHTAKRCGNCRDKAVGVGEASVTAQKNAITPLSTELAQKQTRLKELRDILASETQAIETLASQGLTPDAVITQALGDAQAKLNTENQKAKTKKIVIISIAVAVVILGFIYVYKVIKAKKLKKSK